MVLDNQIMKFIVMNKALNESFQLQFVYLVIRLMRRHSEPSVSILQAFFIFFIPQCFLLVQGVPYPCILIPG